MTRPTTQEIIAKVTEIAEDSAFDCVAIRTQEEPFELGVITETSTQWFGRYEDAVYNEEIDELDGICATHFIDSLGDPVKNAEKLVELHTNPEATYREGWDEWDNYCGIGDHIAVIAGDSYSIGADPGEVIIQDAEVIHIFC